MEQERQKLQYTDPLNLIPYENNPRINDYAVKRVLESIKALTASQRQNLTSVDSKTLYLVYAG